MKINLLRSETSGRHLMMAGPSVARHRDFGEMRENRATARGRHEVSRLKVTRLIGETEVAPLIRPDLAKPHQNRIKYPCADRPRA